MPCFSRSRLLVPTLILLSSAAIVAKGDESVPATLPAAIDAVPLSESGVRLARLLEEDVDESVVPPAPGDTDRLTRLDHDSRSVVPLLTIRDATSPFNLIQAALLTFCAGGATGGIWFAVSRLRRCRSTPAALVAVPRVETSEADLLSRVIAGNLRVTDEALEGVEVSRLFGCATASARYRLEIVAPEVMSQVSREIPVEDSAFHRVSEGAVEVEPPHFHSHRPAGSLVERQAVPGGGTA